MNLMHRICLILILISNVAFAKDRGWLSDYLKQKSINCEMSPDQFRAQATKHESIILQQIAQSLRERNIKFIIEPPRDDFEIGVYANLSWIDFDFTQVVPVYLANDGTAQKQYPLHIQTTDLWETPANQVKDALWFPLHIKNPRSGKPCELERVVVSPNDQETLPVVKLVFGTHEVASLLADIVDVSEEASPIDTATALAPQTTPPPVPEVKVVEEKKPEEKKPSAAKEEDRDEVKERRHRRYSERRREWRHHRRVRAEAPHEAESRQSAGAPAHRNGCDGDKSAWKAVTCAVTGQ